jgi:hypothetical protein
LVIWPGAFRAGGACCAWLASHTGRAGVAALAFGLGQQLRQLGQIGLGLCLRLSVAQAFAQG